MNLRAFAVAAVISVSPALAGSFEFTGRWAQVASTGGDCPTCALSIVDEGDRLEVKASNGWTAEVSPTRRPSEASVMGAGRWPSWGDRPVRVFLLVDGDGDLIMQMAIRHPDGRDQIVHAVFRRGASV